MALTGSSAAAFRAGSQQANSPTAANTVATTRKIEGLVTRRQLVSSTSAASLDRLLTKRSPAPICHSPRFITSITRPRVRTQCHANADLLSTPGAYINSSWPQLALFLIGLYLLFAARVVDQWEKVAILRFGKYRGLRGPGLFFMVPVIDSLSRYIDQRVRVSTVSAEAALTRDTVPVNVDAIVFWLVWNAEKSILEVENFTEAITLSAQTALRESIGRHQLAQMITDRDTLGHELQKTDEKTTPLGNHRAIRRDSGRPYPAGPRKTRCRSRLQAERERQA